MSDQDTVTPQPTHKPEYVSLLAEQLNAPMMKMLAGQDFELISNGELIKDLAGRTLYFGRIVPLQQPEQIVPQEVSKEDAPDAGKGEGTAVYAGTHPDGAIPLEPATPKEGKLVRVEFPVHVDAPMD